MTICKQVISAHVQRTTHNCTTPESAEADDPKQGKNRKEPRKAQTRGRMKAQRERWEQGWGKMQIVPAESSQSMFIKEF